MASAVTDVADHEGCRARSCAAVVAAIAFAAAAADRSTFSATGSATTSGTFSARRFPHLRRQSIPGGLPAARLARVAADHERVTRAGGGHVEQTIDLGVEIRLLRRFVRIPARGLGEHTRSQ